MPEKRFVLLIAAAVILMTSVPYIAAFQSGGDGWQFGGFLINPTDGQSYLAKMQQGLRGEWKFTLPYTADSGNGAYLFLFYLGMGHLSRVLGLPLILVYHCARLLAGGLLAYAVWHLTKAVIPDAASRKAAYALAMVGSGLGWIAVAAGWFTSDFWVAEAYPFLSVYATPHFGFGLALMILALLPSENRPGWTGFLLGIAIAVVQPFGVVIVGLVKAADWAIRTIQEYRSGQKWRFEPRTRSLLGFGLGGGPILIYQYWAILADPVLRGWNAQNVTATPPGWDLAVALSPCLLLAAVGAWRAWRSGKGQVLVLWAAISLTLVYLPWNLQRRFLTGIFVPLALTGAFGIVWLKEHLGGNLKFWAALVIMLSLPTNLIVLISGLQAVSSRDRQIFVDPGTAGVLEWLGSHAEEGALILADEDLGLLIPASTGRRVIYGHPFETVNAAAERDFIEKFLNKDQPLDTYREQLNLRGVDLIVLDGDVGSGLEDWLDSNGTLLYSSGGYRVYSWQ